jgi:hypothetical protein
MNLIRIAIDVGETESGRLSRVNNNNYVTNEVKTDELIQRNNIII